MKVLFDSNIHISDVIFGGAATRAIDVTLKARWKLFVCQTILNEVGRVIREKFNRSQTFANATVQMLGDIAEMAEERISRHEVAGDASDTPILRAAVSAGVDYLVTGDSRILAIKVAEGVRIITLTEYLRILKNLGLVQG